MNELEAIAQTGDAGGPRGVTAGATKSAPKRLFSRAAALFWAALALSIVGFLGADRWFYEQISLRINADSPLQSDFYHATKWFWFVCRLWSHAFGGMVVYFAIVAFHPRGWRMANRALVAVASVAIVAHISQLTISRYRPNQASSHLAFGRPFSGFTDRVGVGFPSSEAATAFAASCVLVRVWPRCRRWIYLPAVLAALARLLPGNHYLSDVVVGGMLGVGLGGYLFDHIILWEDELRARLAARGR